jgi:hypothetical protein
MRIFQRAALGTIGLAFCLASLPSSFGQTVYSYVDENGVPNFTNIPPQGAVRDLKVRHPITALEPVPAPDREPGYEAIIRKYAGQFRRIFSGPFHDRDRSALTRGGYRRRGPGA